MASAAETSRLFRLPVELQRGIFSHLPVDLHVIAGNGDVTLERSDDAFCALFRLRTVSRAFRHRLMEAIGNAIDERRICIVLDKRNVPTMNTTKEWWWWQHGRGTDVPSELLTRFQAVEMVLPHVLKARKQPGFSFNEMDIDHTAKTLRMRLERATKTELFRVTSLAWTTETFPRSPWLYAFHGMARDHRDAEIMLRDAELAVMYANPPTGDKEKDNVHNLDMWPCAGPMVLNWEESGGNRAQTVDAWFLEDLVDMFDVDGTTYMQWTPDWEFDWQTSSKAANHAERLIMQWDERWVEKLGWLGMEKVRRAWPGQYFTD
ncbi:unnamed protein product [Zymoseptoria tritici ST99CH_1E4]|uniref:Uncharacterized protein n=1 Tax=Zymoseptoria tritici ST99CH_1E4 TaxID=1276532 RepID=A0A2H1GQF8_ZYMTR|nr:unnamed protein product [Zymoseptoria tritici ST99CH_1E4]